MSDQARIRILSVDGHPLLREGIAAVIDDQPDMVLVSQASSGAEAIQQYRKHRPDIALMDLRLPDLSGVDAIIAIRSEFTDARIVMLTTFDGDVEIHRALQAGARGYLLKNMPPSELAAAIRQVYQGHKRVPPAVAAQLAQHMSDEALTAREVEVLRRVAAGNRNREIAEILPISEETVKVHVKHIHGEAWRQRPHSGDSQSVCDAALSSCNPLIPGKCYENIPGVRDVDRTDID
jgi:DNA-binding NarL/FixJ family response regulator